MPPIATDVARSVVYVSVCLLGTRTSCINMAEPIEMPFGGGLTHVGRRYQVSDGGHDRTNPFATTRGDKTAMRPFVIWQKAASPSCHPS